MQMMTSKQARRAAYHSPALTTNRGDLFMASSNDTEPSPFAPLSEWINYIGDAEDDMDANRRLGIATACGRDAWMIARELKRRREGER